MPAPFDLAATANRLGQDINATVYAVLPDGCHEATVTDIYPGGNIQYLVDPGVARIFVCFTRRDGPCTDAIRPWRDSRDIPDPNHDQLEVVGEFEGTEFTVTVPVHDFIFESGPGLDSGFNPGSMIEEFIVIALMVSAGDSHVACTVVHKDSKYPAIFSQVFGPATYAACRAWIGGNCIPFESADGADRE
jgi:hypothetical protein